MATRCQIAFYQKPPTRLMQKGWEALIYRHWDGYPEGVLPDLLPVLKEFNEGRGLSDIEHGSAWVVKCFKDDFLNIGISQDFHGAIEYVYAVSPGQLDVWDVWGKKKISSHKL